MTFLGFMAVWVVVSIVTALAVGAFIRSGRRERRKA